MTHFPQRIAADRGDAPALTDERGSTSWTELNARSNRLVHAFRAMGLAPGDAIAIYAGNCREYYEVMMAANHAGLIYVPVNWHFSPEELAYVIDNAGARLLVTEGQFLANAELGSTAVSLLTNTVEPGAEAPLHTHTVEETMLVLEGRVWAQVGDERYEVTQHHTVVIPPNTPHAWGNDGESEAKLLWAFAGADPFGDATYHRNRFIETAYAA